MRTSKLITTLALACLATAAIAQDRPSEEELFGGPTPPARPSKPDEKKKSADEKKPAAPPKAGEEKPPAPPNAGGAEGPHGETEAELFGSQSSPQATPPPAGALISREREDWLKIGGQLQLRAFASAYQDTPPADWPYGSPNLLDVYLDARPNDRVRAFVLGRMRYDPSLPPSGRPTGAATVTEGTTATTPADVSEAIGNPGAVLDQLWVKFDLYQRAFVTAGRQHVKWGVGHFWNPTDYLHRIPRDPLATFDVRTGTALVRVHLPWEKRGWNLYGVAILEDVAGNLQKPPNRLGQLGGGGRAELVLGPAELGLDAVAQRGHHPRYGVDLSTGLGDFDLYTEAALRSGGDTARWERGGSAPSPIPELGGWQRDVPEGLTPQVVVGGSWSWKYSDQDSLTVGAEYFYNDLGYDDSSVYPFLLLGAPAFDLSGPVPRITQQDPGAFRPFYLGRHYAAVNLLLPQPGSWNDTTLIFSVVGNLSDRSYLARVDTSVRVLTYMTVETFVAGHFGQKGGEFRLALPASLVDAAGPGSGFTTAAPLFDVGVALRVSL